MAPKTCDLDPIPTSLLYDCIDEIVPMLTDVLNVSIASGSVPNSLKKAIVNRILKKASLDPNVLNISGLYLTFHLCQSSWKELCCLNFSTVSDKTISGTLFSLHIDPTTVQRQRCSVFLATF